MISSLRLAFFAVVLFTFVYNPASGQNRDHAAAVDSIAQSYVDAGRIAGMSVTVQYQGRTLVSRGYGLADLELGIAMPDNAVFSVGSITKQFSSVAILQLVEQGKLDLNADMSEYLPDYPMNGRNVTLRQLLDHTSGIQGMTEMPEFENMHPDSPRDSVLAAFASHGFWHEPGAQEIYNNSAYFLLGYIIEGATGMSYEEYLSEKIFEPLGLKQTHYCSNTRIVRNRAHGYDLDDGELVHTSYLNYRIPYSAGSVCSTSENLASWMQQLHHGRVLGDAMYAALIKPGTLSDGSRTRYAAGLEHVAVLGHRRIGHGGAINGFLSASGYFPDDDLYIVVLINTTGPVSPDRVTRDIVMELLGDATQSARDLDFDPTPFLGNYEGTDRGGEATITIAMEDGKVTIKGRNPAATMEYLGDHSFRLPESSLIVRLVTAASGEKRLHVDSGYNYPVFRRIGE